MTEKYIDQFGNMATITIPAPMCKQLTEKETLFKDAASLRKSASRGKKRIAHLEMAIELEARASKL